MILITIDNFEIILLCVIAILLLNGKRMPNIHKLIEMIKTQDHPKHLPQPPKEQLKPCPKNCPKSFKKRRQRTTRIHLKKRYKVGMVDHIYSSGKVHIDNHTDTHIHTIAYNRLCF